MVRNSLVLMISPALEIGPWEPSAIPDADDVWGILDSAATRMALEGTGVVVDEADVRHFRIRNAIPSLHKRLLVDREGRCVQ